MSIIIVPLKMINSKLVHEKEIPPGLLCHIIESLGKKDCSTERARAMLKILRDCPLDTRCIYTIVSAIFNSFQMTAKTRSGKTVDLTALRGTLTITENL